MSIYTEFVKYYNLVFPFKEATLEFLKGYINDSTANVLDIGCGTGTYINRLSEITDKAIGIDIDKEMILYAKENYKGGHYHQMDVSKIDLLANSFNLIYSIGNVISHLPKERLADFIEKVFSCLSDDGYWIFQVVNWDYILTTNTFSFGERMIGDNLTFTREYPMISEDSLDFKIELKSPDKIIFSETTTLYPLRSADYINLHNEKGFVLVDHFIDFKKNPYDENENGGNILVFQKMKN